MMRDFLLSFATGMAAAAGLLLLAVGVCLWLA